VYDSLYHKFMTVVLPVLLLAVCEEMMLTLLIILLVLALVGGLPHWSYMEGRSFGYWPSGIVTLLLILVLLVMFGVLPAPHWR